MSRILEAFDVPTTLHYPRKKVLALSNAAADQLGHQYIGTEHLLMGLLDEKNGIAAQMLVHLGVTRERIDELFNQVLSGRPI